nr:hypothetical protein [Tanacetum cinerariifolium]
AFQVTADVLKIYMQEFWATAKLHDNSIHFKMDTKKSILDLKAFREMLHISPRIPSQSLSATAKGKRPARAITPTEPTDVKRTEAEQLKIVLKKGRQETHVSQQRGSSTDEGTGSRPGVPDVPSDDSEEELSWNSSGDEEGDEQTKGREESEGDKTDESDDRSDDDNDETIKAGSESDKDDDDNDDEEEPAKNDDEDTKDPPLDQTGGLKDKKKEPRRPPSPDRDWNKTLPAAQGDVQSWISNLAKQTDARSSFNELLDTPIDFSNF